MRPHNDLSGGWNRMRFLAGFLIGLPIGVLAVLLTAPQSGRDLQDGVRSRIDNILAAGRNAAARRRAELEAELAELKAGET
jgi:gas vesicle protein